MPTMPSGVSLAVDESLNRPRAWPTFPLSNDKVTRRRAGRSSSSGLPQTNTIWRGTRVSSLVASMPQPPGSSLRYGRGVSWISAFTSAPLPSSVLTSLKVRRVAVPGVVEPVDRKSDEEEVAVVVAARTALGQRGVGQRLEPQGAGPARRQGHLELILVAAGMQARGQHRAIGLGGQRRGACAGLGRWQRRPGRRGLELRGFPRGLPGVDLGARRVERRFERGQFGGEGVAPGGSARATADRASAPGSNGPIPACP